MRSASGDTSNNLSVGIFSPDSVVSDRPASPLPHWLSLFASLQYFGTLLSPMFGVMGNRIGTKRLICGMRAVYAVLSLAMLTLIFAGQLSPLYVFIVSGLMGMVRPSDLVMRYALIGESMPANSLLVASSVSRTTQDSARVMGALTGAGMVAAFGMGAVYVTIACLYGVSLLLTTQVTSVRRKDQPRTTRIMGVKG